MRRSLPVRLLGLSLVVAALAIAATTWLITRDTSERFRGEFAQTLEFDTFIYQNLILYAEWHDSWDDVGEVVDELADVTGRRVALTTLDGALLADSSARTGTGNPLPSNATAQVDPQLPSIVAETTLIGYEGDTVVAETFSAADVDIDDLPLGALGSLGFTAPGLSPLWRATDDEMDARSTLVAEAQRCLEDEFDTDGQVVVTPSGDVLVVDSPYLDALAADLWVDGLGGIIADGTESTSLEIVPSDGHGCVPAELREASQAALEFNAIESDIMQACLDQAGVDYVVRTLNSGLVQTVPAPVVTDDDEPPVELPDHETWADCQQLAADEANAEFMAPPILLYTGTTDRFDPFFGDGWWRTVIAGLAVLAAATAITAVVGRRMTRPIHALTAAATRMGSGHHATRVTVRGRDEFAKLGTAFNSMAESIESNEAQRRAMISDVAHELRTPLANVKGYLEAAQDGVVPTDPELISSLLEEATLLERLVTDLQDLALADAGMLRLHSEPRPAAEIVRQVAAAHGQSAQEPCVILSVDVSEERRAYVDVDAGRIRQALGNLVANAIRFTPDGGTVTLSVRREDSTVAFAVRDDGPGIPTEHLPRLFDRFYRVEGSRSRETGGSGLGLAITRHLVEAHGGSIDVDSTEGVGSVFTIRLPALDQDNDQ